ncbi:MAG: histone deacetylase family protein [Pseudomonadota bacterium]
MTVLVTHVSGGQHVTPPHVHEQAGRLDAVLGALGDLGLEVREAPLAQRADVLRCHTDAYVSAIDAAVPSTGWTCLDADREGETFLSPSSLGAIWRAAGGAVAAVDAILDGAARNAFVAMRPPGHHAEAALAMGFCIFGNVAIAAKHALARGVPRVAVLDFDVHHGNGTQTLLESDPRVLFVSVHQVPLWPGTGMSGDVGPHGTVLNLPLGAGTGEVEALLAWDSALRQVRAFAPGLILISAGFDAHQDDPLAELRWTAGTYAKLTHRITNLAQDLCEGRVVSVLEGGYDLGALASSARAHVMELQKAAR